MHDDVPVPSTQLYPYIAYMFSLLLVYSDKLSLIAHILKVSLPKH